WVVMACAAGTHCDREPWLTKHWSPCVGGGDYGYEPEKPKYEPKPKYGGDDCSTSEGSWEGQNYDCGAPDKSSFRQCANGKWVVMPCAAGTHCDREPWLTQHWSPCVAGGYSGKAPAYTPPSKPSYEPSYAPAPTPSYA
ncbi:hypothetical protein HK101_002899, partial [Irineochytrium annulatum]